MKTDNRIGRPSLVRLITPICLIACATVLISLGFPYKSLGGGTPGRIELKENKAPTGIKDNASKMMFKEIRGRVYSLAVNIDGDDYVAEAQILVENSESVGAQSAILIIPAARVQRIFELAMARELDVVAWGYSITAPEGHIATTFPFFKIAVATVYDTKLIATSKVIG